MPKIPLEDLTERYGFCDPASSKKMAIKSVRARSAIIIVAVDSLFRFFVLYAWADRVATDVLRDKIIQVTEDFKPRRFGIEANAMQSLFADLVREKATSMGKTLPLTAVDQPTKVDKDWRIRTTLQAIIADGRLILQPNQFELKQEIEGFPMMPRKDLIDALASAVRLAPKKRAKQQKREEITQLAEYLRNTGAPSWCIEKRLREEIGVQEYEAAL